MIFRVSGVFLLWLVCSCNCQEPPASPCPDVFSYQQDPSGVRYGVVSVLSPATFSEARLVFKMTVANYFLDRGIGRVEIFGGIPEAQEISKSAYRGEKRRIRFLIIFPPVDTIPHVTEVLINDVTFCHDRRDYGPAGNIELKYTLKTGLDVPVVSGNAFSTVPAHLQGQNLNNVADFPSNENNYPKKIYTKWSYSSEFQLIPISPGSQSYSPPGLGNLNNGRQEFYNSESHGNQDHLATTQGLGDRNYNQAATVLSQEKEQSVEINPRKKTLILIETLNHAPVNRVTISTANNTATVHVR